MESWTTAAPFLGLAGLACSLFLYMYVKKGPVGTQEMAAISEAIHEGAMAFLKREYTILLVFVIAVFALLFAFIGAQTAYAFLAGAACSIAAGFTGMKAATHANVRTAQAANQQGQGPALMMAFSGGAVMGLSVASLGLLGVGALANLFGIWENIGASASINGFAMGASSIALFARVGGGIFTKTADVGADLVGKVEAGIPEDDPRNPAVIADNVGDNVGDVAGMGADIFESYVGSVIATTAIAATASLAALQVLAPGLDEAAGRLATMSFPLIVIMIGLLASIVGVFSVRVMQNADPGAALRYSTFYLRSASDRRCLLGERTARSVQQRGLGAECGLYRWNRHWFTDGILHGRQAYSRYREGFGNGFGHKYHLGSGRRYGKHCTAHFGDRRSDWAGF